jgi:hypothetical protein
MNHSVGDRGGGVALGIRLSYKESYKARRETKKQAKKRRPFVPGLPFQLLLKQLEFPIPSSNSNSISPSSSTPLHPSHCQVPGSCGAVQEGCAGQGPELLKRQSSYMNAVHEMPRTFSRDICSWISPSYRNEIPNLRLDLPKISISYAFPILLLWR